MEALEKCIDRIAECHRIRRVDAAAYVKSIARQIGAKDDLAVADAIIGLLERGEPFKAKDVARVLNAGSVLVLNAGESTSGPITSPAKLGTTPLADLHEPPVPFVRPDAEARRDTRLRFEQWAKNPKCEANVLSAVHGVSMAVVAKAEGLEPTMGQSPFALARGQRFEGLLFRNGAERLIPELALHEVLPKPEAEFRDFRLRLNGGPHRTLDEAKAATSALLRDVAAGKGGKKPIVAAGATIRIPGGGMLPEAILVVDALVVRRDLAPPRLVVGEVKTYPDRAGYTDAKELAVARAQAGVYVQGLRLVLAELGLDGKVEVAKHGFLVLRRPGWNWPSVRAGEDLEFQAIRAERGFEKLRKAAAALPPKGKDMDAAIRAAEVAYGEGCLSFCDRAPLCWRKAEEAGEAAILGEDVARWVGPVGLHRALELLDGKKPKTEAEEDLLRRIEEARLPEIVS